MKFLKNKNKQQMSASQAKIFDKPKLKGGVEVDGQHFEEILKTTDSMKVMANEVTKINSSTDTNDSRLEDAKNALLKSYDLAVRKIAAVYAEIMDAQMALSNDYLTVQLIIKEFEKNADIDHVAKVINFFTEEMEQQIAHGRSVKLDNKLIIEPANYANKIIPTVKYVGSNYVNVNTVTWLDIANALHSATVITSMDKELIASLIQAVMVNLQNGYYVKLGSFIIARTRMDSEDLMIVFSQDTITRLNKVFNDSRFKENEVVTHTNHISAFKQTNDLAKNLDDRLLKELVTAENTGRQNESKLSAVIQAKEEAQAVQVQATLMKKQERENLMHGVAEKVQQALKAEPEDDLEIEDQILQKIKNKEEAKTSKSDEE